MKRASLIALLFAALIGLASCVKEDLPGRDLHAGMGRIELSLCSDISVETKAGAPVSDDFFNAITFTISGSTSGGGSIDAQSIEFTRNGNGTAVAYFQAGTYTLSASYEPQDADSGTGKICYSGVSEPFTVNTAGLTDGISIEMTPSNAKVIVTFHSSLAQFYGQSTVDFTSPRTFGVSSVAASADENGDIVIEAYLPADQAASYGISCTPLAGSGAKAVNLTGLGLNNGAALQKGKSYAITVRLIPGGVAIFLDGSSSPIATTAATWTGLFS